MPETQCVELTAGPMGGGVAPHAPGSIGPGRCATFVSTLTKGYAGETGPLSLGLCQSECLSMGSRKPIP